MFNKYSYKDIDYAKAIEANGFLSNRTKSECEILAKYYNILGYSKKDIKTKIIEVCNRSIKDFYYEMYYKAIESAINSGVKKEPIQVNSITFYKEELDYINSLDLNYMVKKLIYGILTLKKLSKEATHSEKLGFTLIGSPTNYSKIKTFAGLKNKSQSQINLLFADMLDLGLISIRDDDKKYLLFLDNIQDSKDIAFTISNFETAILHFDNYNEKYKITKCEVCDEWFKIESKSFPPKYCKECAKKVHNEQKSISKKVKKATK